MRSKLLLSGLLATALSVPAMAQTAAPSATQAPANTPAATSTMPMGQASSWRASQLIGVDVYNDKNESLGDINEVLIDQSGKVTGIVIGVGGFLGMGERNIMVSMDKLKFSMEPRSTSTTARTTAPATGTASTTTASGSTAPAARTANTSANRSARAANERWYPDHAILAGATKDSVKAMPEFKYNN